MEIREKKDKIDREKVVRNQNKVKFSQILAENLII